MPAAPLPAWLRPLARKHRLAPSIMGMLARAPAINAPIPGTTPPMVPLTVLAESHLPDDRAGHMRALVDAGARLVPDPAGPWPSLAEHPLAYLIITRSTLFDTFFDALAPAQRAALPHSLVVDGADALSLLDLALVWEHARAATRLWDEAGAAPHPSRSLPRRRGTSKPGRRLMSTLEVAMGLSRSQAGQVELARVVDRILDSPWPARDLDAALVRGVNAGLSLAHLERLLAAGAKPARAARAWLPAGTTLLAQALRAPWEPQPGVVSRLIQAGEDPHQALEIKIQRETDPEEDPPLRLRGGQPLGLAAYRGFAQAADELLTGGADPDHATPTGVTALHLAAAGNPHRMSAADRGRHVIDLLLDAGAHPARPARWGLGATCVQCWMRADFSDPPGHPGAAAAAQRLLEATLGACPQLLGWLDVAPADALRHPVAAAWHQVLARHRRARQLRQCLPDPPTASAPGRL